MAKTYLTDIIAILFILLFVYAGLSKLLDYTTFKSQIERSPYLTRYASFLAWMLPLSEIVIAGLLVFKRTRGHALYASFFLMLLFTGYIYDMIHYSPFLPCSCGGILSKMSWQQHLNFNIAYTLLGLTGIFVNVRTA